MKTQNEPNSKIVINAKAIGGFMAAILLLSTPTSAYADKEEKDKGVTVEETVMAPPEVSFQSLHAIKDSSSACKLISGTGNDTVVEEVFEGLPMLKEATCVY